MKRHFAAALALLLALVGVASVAQGQGQDATHRKFMATWSAIERGELETVTRALDEGLPINYQDDDGYTLLHIAAKEGKRDIVAELLRRGANPGIRTRMGFYPYDSGSNYGGIVDMLVAAGGPKPPGYRPLLPPTSGAARPSGPAPRPAASPKANGKVQSAREKICEARWYSSQALCGDSTCKMREYRKWQTCLNTGSYY